MKALKSISIYLLLFAMAVTAVLVYSKQKGTTPFEEAVEAMVNNNYQGLQKLIEVHPELSTQQQEVTGYTLLHLAAFNNLISAVRLLLKLGANPNMTDAIGETPLVIAVRSGEIGFVDALIDGGANPHLTDARFYLLNEAVAHNDSVMIEYLIAKGFDPNFGGLGVHGTLWEAVSSGTPSIVSQLIDHGANLSMKDSNGSNPLWLACNLQRIRSRQTPPLASLVSLLVARGAPVRPDSTYLAPIAGAIGCTSISDFKILMEHGATLSYVNPHDPPFCLLAYESDDTAFASTLLSYGAEINEMNPVHPEPPMMIAIKQYRTALVYWLLAHGCDLNLKDASGKDAASLALSRADTNLYLLLTKRWQH